MRFLCTVILVLLAVYPAVAQSEMQPCAVRVHVVDSVSHEPLFLSTVALLREGRQFRASSCNASGEVLMRHVPAGRYRLMVTFVGYRSFSSEIELKRDMSRDIALAPLAVRMPEVVVTAREKKGITSSSIIGRKAMEHLQPSSFTDLLELLPGGRSKDPDLTEVNPIRLREAGGGVSSADYDIASRGVAFMINGTPVNTGADMLYISGEADYDHRRHSMVNRGVDMRSISTDAIEQVEIVRGIPSVEYGSLTSGLVNIRRRSGGNRLHARFKADESSKLVYLGKGFELPARQMKLNADIDWLSAKADPRDQLENYKRLTLSLRMEKTWRTDRSSLVYSSTLDYGGSFNTEETDVNRDLDRSDSYKYRVNRFSTINNLQWKNLDENAIFRSLHFNSSLSFSKDEIRQVRFCTLNRPVAVPQSKEEGVQDAEYLKTQYLGRQKVDNRPFGANARLTVLFRIHTGGARHDLKAGADWQMNKNYGKGQVYDPHTPVHFVSISTRPRPYDDIPAGHDLSFFAEDYMSLPLGNHCFELQAGVRANTQLNLPSRYRLHGRINWDPRVNARWIFPGLTLGGEVLVLEAGGGVGWHSLAPGLDQLYPDLVYDDIVQLNYYHRNPEYRRMNMKTFVHDPANFDLDVARNFKWEVRGNASYAGHDLSVTFFRERMNSGFRTGTETESLIYTKYDASGLDHASMQAPPVLEELPSVQDTLLRIYGKTTNGTSLRKSGVEFQFSSRRIRSLATRITVSGACFRTVYSNSEGYFEGSDKVLEGRRFPYVGWYDDPDGYIRRSFNTNFIFDTYIGRMKLGFSLAAQCHWFSDQQTERKTGIPVYYVDLQGERHPYTEASREDAYLQWLVKDYAESLFARSEMEHFNVNFNLKVTKRLYGDRINLALFVNRLLSIHPDYHSHGMKVRRVGGTPYFGMELNFNL